LLFLASSNSTKNISRLALPCSPGGLYTYRGLCPNFLSLAVISPTSVEALRPLVTVRTLVIPAARALGGTAYLYTLLVAKGYTRFVGKYVTLYWTGQSNANYTRYS